MAVLILDFRHCMSKHFRGNFGNLSFLLHGLLLRKRDIYIGKLRARFLSPSDVVVRRRPHQRLVVLGHLVVLRVVGRRRRVLRGRRRPEERKRAFLLVCIDEVRSGIGWLQDYTAFVKLENLS